MGLVADVFDMLIIDPVNKTIIGSTTLQDANIEFSMDTNDVRAGQGNNLIAILHSTRDINIPVTDVEWKYEYLAMYMGQDIVTGAGVAYAFPTWYDVVMEDSSATITLKHTPENGANITYTLHDGSTVEGTLAGNTVTFSTGVESGDQVLVGAYKYATPAGTETIEFDIKKFPRNFQVVLQTIEIDNDEHPTHYLQYAFDNVTPDGNFTINTTLERTASTQQMTFRVLKPKTSTKIGRALRIPIEDSET